MNKPFNYKNAFSRTVGWVTPDELERLRQTKVAIGGLGGVGGAHLLMLTRLGIGRFSLAEFDEFEEENSNRQAGAGRSTLGRRKLDVMVERALDINPDLELDLYPQGVQRDSVDGFLNDVDVYVDGLDFFALDARKLVYRKCQEYGIPITTAAPLGMGTAVLNFLPYSMGYEDYFQFEGQSQDEQYLRFLLGLSPSMMQMKYLVHPQAVDLPNRKGPSTPMACELCAGLVGTQVLKMVLNRGKIIAAPKGMHFDAFSNKLKITNLPKGNSTWHQKIKLAVARRRLASPNQAQPVNEIPLATQPGH